MKELEKEGILNASFNFAFLNGLFVVADVVDGGGDLPVKRTADVEESQEKERRQYYTKRQL